MCNFLYIFHSKIEFCESNTLNFGENYPIWFSVTYLKLSERGTITEGPDPGQLLSLFFNK